MKLKNVKDCLKAKLSDVKHLTEAIEEEENKLNILEIKIHVEK